LVSVPLLLEYEAVMSRTEHLGAAGLVGSGCRLDYLWRPTLPDADDDMVLEAAVNGRADSIVTFNLRDFRPWAERFGVAVMSPGEAVTRSEKRS
jgi:hypothetical protein